MQDNPLLAIPNTPFQTPPFAAIKNEHFAPAFEILMEEGKKNIHQIIENTENPTFDNTIVALENAGRLLNRSQSIFYNLEHTDNNEIIQQISEQYSGKFAEYSNDIILNEKLFQRINQIWQQKNTLHLSAEQEMLLKKTYTTFIKNGANLNDTQKEILREIDKQLAELTNKFGNNVLADTQNFMLEFDNENDLEGLPEMFVAQAKNTAIQKNMPEKWVITLHYPSYIPFMTYIKNRDFRRQLFVAFGTRGMRENKNDEIIKKIVNLRHQRANLLGFDSHAAFNLVDRMAKNPEKVNDFLENIVTIAYPKAKKEVEELTILAKKLDNIEVLEAWDFAYYSEKLKEEKYALDDNMLRPYFKLENVIEGVFKVAQKLFQLQFIARKDIDIYHPEVKVYEVKNAENQTISIFYADFFPRDSKKQGAWMTSFREQSNENNQFQPSQVSIVCNFTPSLPDKPSLLSFNEVTTFFHEFGHALHLILSDVKYESLSGTNVAWDFVELPSQLMENWAYTKDSLDLFAFHYQTNEPISEELIQKIKNSANFQSAYQAVRQVTFGLLDMAFHADLLNSKKMFTFAV
ncbi:MAG: M3 family peptidase [Bacteroidetes bacterium]|nr:MAG: M3 family peptidase [Bacteroidota bacterium]